MKLTWFPGLLAVALASPCPGLLVAQGVPLPVNVSADLDFKSRYLFAGIPFAADEVFQGTVTVGRGGFTFNAFTSYDVELGDVSEGDVWADYYVQLSPLVGAFLGGALYNFKYPDPTGWEMTAELYAGLTVGVPLSPTVYFAHDFDLGDGSHVLFSVSQSVPLGAGGITLIAAGNVDYNDEYYLPGSSFAYADLVLSLGIPTGKVTFSPLVQLQRALDRDRFDDFQIAGVNAHIVF